MRDHATDQRIFCSGFFISYKQISKYVRSSDPVHKSQREGSQDSVSYVAQFIRKHRKSSAANKQGQVPKPEGSTRIKVGFTSRCFGEQASGKMIEGIIGGLDVLKFEIVVFCIKDTKKAVLSHQEGQPGLLLTDDVARRIKERADHYVDLETMKGLAHMRTTVESFELDVLVSAEIGMDPASYLLSHSRLAPVQVATHGHASTTGVDSIVPHTLRQSLLLVLNTRARTFFAPSLLLLCSFF